MEVRFDPAKDAANIAKHGLSLATSERFDLLVATVVADGRRDYGEERFRAFQRLDGLGLLSGLYGPRYGDPTDQSAPGA